MYKVELRANSELRITNDELRMTNDEAVIRNSQFVINLTPDERGRLAQNFRGYDISPDMVRLSLVNMYLHGFADPHIYEYDTLTSQERWNEYADVILANPPFMSPKGGIKPHNRFSVQSKRSEVLFVDYMAEHLTPTGRAAIIVPEGIIFQSQNAYKQLRKMLVETALVAVISLPAGVFNPYAGVKTSILILDKSLAKKVDAIAFFKVENDGFGLGAQRREIDKNDLPAVLAAITNYKLRITNGEAVTASDFVIPDSQFVIVPKEKIAANGDYNLSGERYREGAVRATRYPIVQLGEVAEVVAGQSPPGESYNEAGNGVPFYQGKTEFGEMFIGAPTTWTTEPRRFAEAGDILISVRAPVGPVNLATQRVCIGRGLAAIKPAEDRLMPSYAFYFLKSQEAHIKGDAGSTFASINRGEIEKLQIPLPPLDVQQQIVAEIEGYQRVINGARAVLDNYRPHILIRPEWPMVELGEVMERHNEIIHPGDRQSGELTFVGMEHIEEGTGQRIGSTTVDLGRMTGRKPMFKKGQIVYGYLRPYLNKVWIAEFDGCSSVDQFAFEVNKERAEPKFVATFLRSDSFLSQSGRSTTRAQLPRISIGEVLAAKIPLPPLATQQAIVAEIEAEQALVAANRELIARFEGKIQAALARVWGE